MLEHWSLIECDLQDRQIDLGDPALMTSRSWPWLRTRILGLLSADSRLHRALVSRHPASSTASS